MPVYCLEPYAPHASGWQKSILDPMKCWVVADDEDDARAKLASFAYGARAVEPDNAQPELLPWTTLAVCSLDEAVNVPVGVILTETGQRLIIPGGA
jgi:hypothetical protein